MPLKQLYSGTEVLKKFLTKLEFCQWRVRVGPWQQWPGLAPYSSCSPGFWADSSLQTAELTLGCLPRAVGAKMTVTKLKPEAVCGQSDAESPSRGDWSPGGWESGGMGESRICGFRHGSISFVDFRTSHWDHGFGSLKGSIVRKWDMTNSLRNVDFSLQWKKKCSYYSIPCKLTGHRFTWEFRDYAKSSILLCFTKTSGSNWHFTWVLWNFKGSL